MKSMVYFSVILTFFLNYNQVWDSLAKGYSYKACLSVHKRNARGSRDIHHSLLFNYLLYHISFIPLVFSYIVFDFSLLFYYIVCVLSHSFLLLFDPSLSFFKCMRCLNRCDLKPIKKNSNLECLKYRLQLESTNHQRMLFS